MILRSVLALLVLARVAATQQDSARRTPGAAISGVVHDSIAHKPLTGAHVQLVTADHQTKFGRSAVTDGQGRFTLDDVPDGAYMIGFFHPVLDSLGLEPALRAVSVVDRRAVHVDLSTPSAARLRAAICGGTARPDSDGVVLGIVRDARDASPLAGVNVVGRWFEYTVTSKTISHRTARTSATTRDNGWFALCNLPSSATFGLSANRGDDSTDVIDVEIPIEGFARRELYLGAARTVGAVVSDTATRRLRAGGGRLHGVVVMAANGRPLAGAQVSIPDGPETRANEKGEWTLVGAPTGTRVLEVRAVGYFPDRRSVNVIDSAPSVRSSLVTMKAMLDTVRITASRRTLAGSGFEDRRRGAGSGHFLTAADFARAQPVLTTDLFRMVPGVRVERVGMQRQMYLRGAFADWCQPAVYINGMFMSDISADDLDDYVNPSDVAGIEFYTTAVPPQFSHGFAACGSIVVWTNPVTGSVWTKMKIISAATFVVVGIGLSLLLMRR
jgi:hypothetical protein